jgi:hypothetical protein
MLSALTANAPLINIDYYGELLGGCSDCNCWGRPGDKRLVMELLEEDLQALREARKSRRRLSYAAKLRRCEGHDT